MKLKQIIGMTFISERIAFTDIHNAGTIFGVIYHQVLCFLNNNNVILKNRIEINRAPFPEWSKNIENESWSGKYEFDIDDKHVKCSFTNDKNKSTKIIYANFATEDLLICEVYENGNHYGQGKVFEKIS